MLAASTLKPSLFIILEFSFKAGRGVFRPVPPLVIDHYDTRSSHHVFISPYGLQGKYDRDAEEILCN
jgi:hypothetical protein